MKTMHVFASMVLLAVSGIFLINAEMALNRQNRFELLIAESHDVDTDTIQAPNALDFNVIQSALITFAIAGDEVGINFIFQMFPDRPQIRAFLTMPDSENLTMLMHACINRHFDLARYLILSLEGTFVLPEYIDIVASQMLLNEVTRIDIYNRCIWNFLLNSQGDEQSDALAAWIIGKMGTDALHIPDIDGDTPRIFSRILHSAGPGRFPQTHAVLRTVMGELEYAEMCTAAARRHAALIPHLNRTIFLPSVVNRPLFFH
jgi:hypothetical protein